MRKSAEEEIGDDIPCNLNKLRILALPSIVFSLTYNDVLQHGQRILPAKVRVHRLCDFLYPCRIGKSESANNPLHTPGAGIAPWAIDFAEVGLNFYEQKERLVMSQPCQDLVINHRTICNEFATKGKSHSDQISFGHRMWAHDIRMDDETRDGKESV